MEEIEQYLTDLYIFTRVAFLLSIFNAIALVVTLYFLGRIHSKLDHFEWLTNQLLTEYAAKSQSSERASIPTNL